MHIHTCLLMDYGLLNTGLQLLHLLPRPDAAQTLTSRRIEVEEVHECIGLYTNTTQTYPIIHVVLLKIPATFNLPWVKEWFAMWMICNQDIANHFPWNPTGLELGTVNTPGHENNDSQLGLQYFSSVSARSLEICVSDRNMRFLFIRLYNRNANIE